MQPTPARFEVDRSLPLRRCLAGLRETDLLTDLASGPHTLLAPVDAAFDALPWPFERLLADESLLEQRFDLFEYLVMRGTCDADAPPRRKLTLQGDPIVIGGRRVFGEQGVARILGTARWRSTIIHAVDTCVLPSQFPAPQVQEGAPLPSNSPLLSGWTDRHLTPGWKRN